VFDYLRTYQGKPFQLKAHLQRLRYSAQQIGLKLPKTLEEIESIITEVLHLNVPGEYGIKIIVTGGASPDQITPGPQSTLIILAYPFKPYPAHYYQDGIHAISTKLPRSIPTSKTLHYIPAIMALNHARSAGADDALFLNPEGNLLEATTSNFFAIQGNTLLTPNSEEVLFGITREAVIEAAKEHFDIQFADLPYQNMKDWDEAFITSSNKEIVPVVQIDQQFIGEGKPGLKTVLLMQLFKEYTIRGNWPDLEIFRYVLPSSLSINV
jgi:branched-chain amino acid aminotransferase